MSAVPTPLPQLTPKAIVLGILLSVILAGANAYLGLFAGLTVSASIPAAVISMAILRFFASSNILENNVVQTSASAGESLAAGVIFTLPALKRADFRVGRRVARRGRDLHVTRLDPARLLEHVRLLLGYGHCRHRRLARRAFHDSA